MRRLKLSLRSRGNPSFVTSTPTLNEVFGRAANPRHPSGSDLSQALGAAGGSRRAVAGMPGQTPGLESGASCQQHKEEQRQNAGLHLGIP